jgi:hypothetical protein
MVRTTRPFARPARQTLQRRLGVLAMERTSNRSNASVRRVLELLSEENLTDLAARVSAGDQITIECGVINQVWDDPRVSNRVNQLARQGVDVERETIQTRYGETGLVRDRLVVKF